MKVDPIKIGEALEVAAREYLARPILWLTFISALLLFGITSWVLIYHWSRYTFDYGRIKKIRSLYLAVSVVLLAVMLAILYYLR